MGSADIDRNGSLLCSDICCSAISTCRLKPSRHGRRKACPACSFPASIRVILLASSACVWAGERGIHRSRTGWAIAGLIAAIVLGTCFVGIQLIEWSNKSYGMTTHLYGSLYFTITGFHMATSS